MLEKDLLWAMLPDGLEEFFEIESFNKAPKFFDIVLVEKNIVPILPKQYQGKKIVNNVLKPLTILSFPIKGKHCQITLKRRYWKLEGVDKMYTRELDLCHEGTKLDKEFAVFLKGLPGV
jgi:hypothetical protein